MKKQIYECKDGSNEYFRCDTYYKDNSLCNNQRTINKKIVDALVFDEFKKQIDQYCNFDKIKIREKHERELDKTNEVIKQKENLLKDIDRKIEMMYSDRISGAITLEQFEKFTRNCQKEMANIGKELEHLNKKAKPNQRKKVDTAEFINRYKNIKELSREIIEEFITDIHITKIDEETGQREIKINWEI